VADAASHQADKGLAFLLLAQLHVLDDERLAEALEHGGADLHLSLPPRSVAARI
jgi:hypothetical protein